ncbi:MAG: arginine N-succinyltransferase [Acidithiobacillus sp.]
MTFSGCRSLATQMYVRPVEEADLDSLYCLSKEAPVGLTSLPANRKLLADKIEESMASLCLDDPAAWRRLLLVLVDTANGEIAGISGIEREADRAHHYRKVSDPARLQLRDTPVSPTKLGSLMLRAAYRGRGLGALLSKSRFLYIADHQQYFGGHLHAELRGWSSPRGDTPFWSEIGRLLYDKDLSEMDQLRGRSPASFASQYLSNHDIPMQFLSPHLQQNLGRVHADAKNALRMLEQERFVHTDHIDVLDGGPILRASIQDIYSIRTSTVFTIDRRVGTEVSVGKWMISNRAGYAFRACVAPAYLDAGALLVDSEVIELLRVEPGASVRALATRGVVAGDRHG